MRGAPQVGFSATIRKIRARTSLLTPFRPPTRRNLEIHVQYKRNPARCQFTTVRGVTKTRGFLHPDQNVLNATQNSLCRAVNRVRGRCACKASSCRRRAKFSRTRSSRERKELTSDFKTNKIRRASQHCYIDEFRSEDTEGILESLAETAYAIFADHTGRKRKLCPKNLCHRRGSPQVSVQRQSFSRGWLHRAFACRRHQMPDLCDLPCLLAKQVLSQLSYTPTLTL